MGAACPPDVNRDPPAATNHCATLHPPTTTTTPPPRSTARDRSIVATLHKKHTKTAIPADVHRRFPRAAAPRQPPGAPLPPHGARRHARAAVPFRRGVPARQGACVGVIQLYVAFCGGCQFVRRGCADARACVRWCRGVKQKLSLEGASCAALSCCTRIRAGHLRARRRDDDDTTHGGGWRPRVVAADPPDRFVVVVVVVVLLLCCCCCCCCCVVVAAVAAVIVAHIPTTTHDAAVPAEGHG